MSAEFALNARAARLVELMCARASELKIATTRTSSGTQLIDCGVSQRGGLEAGRLLAQICLADLAEVTFTTATGEAGGGIAVAVRTDQPTAACMASQYAGWQITDGKFFAMGSGPMRAAGSREPLFEQIGYRERAEQVVGVLETSVLPPESICEQVARDCGVLPEQLTLLCASTHSLAGTIQVVARSVETALHKMHELGFPLSDVLSGYGVAPLPPVAKNFLDGIGLTNDAILYGTEVTLWVTGEASLVQELGPKIPSCASSDYGEPFRQIFERYDRDFYKIDPQLFSPAVVRLLHVPTGRSYRYGQFHPTVLQRSFE